MGFKVVEAITSGSSFSAAFLSRGPQGLLHLAAPCMEGRCYLLSRKEPGPREVRTCQRLVSARPRACATHGPSSAAPLGCTESGSPGGRTSGDQVLSVRSGGGAQVPRARSVQPRGSPERRGSPGRAWAPASRGQQSSRAVQRVPERPWVLPSPDVQAAGR